MLKSKDVLAITYSYFCYGYRSYIFATYFFIYLSTVRGMNLRESSYYTMLPFLAMAVGSPLGGFLSDVVARLRGKRLGRCGVAASAMALAALLLALGSCGTNAKLASLVLVGGIGALFLSQSSYWSVAADIAGPYAGSVSGLMNTSCQIGGAVTASVTPVIALHLGWSASFVAAALLCATGSLTWLLIDPHQDLTRDSCTFH